MSDGPAMDPESPMMKRVERKSSRRGFGFPGPQFRIPKKGRIRVILAIVLCAAVVKIFSNREPADKPIAQTVPVKTQQTGEPQTVPQSRADLPSKSKTAEKPGQSFFARFGFFKQEIHGRNFSFADLCELLRNHTPRLNALSDTLSSGAEKYVLHYSFDTTIMRCGETLLKQYHPKYGALVAMEAKTGRVLALLSYTREAEPPLGDRLFAKSLFPAASVFKTVTAAAALEKGNLSPDSKLPLAGRRYTLYKFQLKQYLASYEPVSLEDAYSYSMNPIFGRIGVFILGPALIRDYMEKFGFNRQVPFELDNDKAVAGISDKDSALAIAEIASGFNQKTRMSPLFGAMLAASVSENGNMPVPFFVDSVTCGDSCVMYRASPRVWRSPMHPATARYLKGMMSRVAQYGTARSSFRYIRHSAFFDTVEYGGKTGTVDEDQLGKIDWFVGFAAHPKNDKQRIAVGVVTVHDQYWTVHSSFIAAEIFRKYIRQSRGEQKAVNKTAITNEIMKVPG
jgi:penicillin-binding protein A